MKKKFFVFFLIIIMTMLSLSACGGKPGQGGGESSAPQTEEASRHDTGFVAVDYNSFDSADTAIFMSRDQEAHTVTLWNLEVGRTYTLAYDGITHFSDKYGESISMAQISPGDVVDVTFLKAQKHLTSMQLSPQIWSLEKVTYFELDGVHGEATVGQEARKLKITANTQFFSEGRPIDMNQIDAVDELSFQGLDKEVLSVKVERGHGYLRLAGQEKFLDGWLEIGQSKIQRITEDMLLPLAEGSYRVNISKDGNGGEKSVVIHRYEETVLDISDLEVAEPETGTILFSLSPSSAKLYVDGEKVDTSLPVTLEYGIHQLIIKAEGYQTLTKYVRVGQPSAGLDIALDPVTDTDSSEESGGTDVATDYPKVYIDAPSDVEVYLDGTYVGTTPCSFQKVEGDHVIMLRKSGFLSKTYKIQLGSENKDISYSFAELEKLGNVTESSETDLTDLLSGALDTLLN